MKRRKSFLKRHFIALTILLLVGVYSVSVTFVKQQRLDELRVKSDLAVAKIQQLEMTLKDKEYELNKTADLDYVEKFARENLKMVYPNEVYFQMTKNK
ncbi:MAG: septum formation initiator family protein [Clostridia bacterium]|nr:septum formation initiator family protein [Clostridia bacterium]